VADICQSCAVPFDEGHAMLRAREPDGTPSPYCVYCYADGAFIDPQATAQDMIEIGVPHRASKVGETQARAELSALVPTLARWA